MDTTLINGLMKAQAYPHAVENIRLVETHISWLLLTGKFVYKLKKPVNFDFLDFTSLEKRRYYCEQELRLNRRYSPDLYLEVVEICGDEDSPRVGGSGPVVDYAVKILEFDQACLLDHIVESQGIDNETLKSIAVQIAQFHQTIAEVQENKEFKYGSAEIITSVVKQNFIQIQASPLSSEHKQTIHALESWSLSELATLREVFVARKEHGFIRECHGDLHLGNMALIDGQVRLFDCIEFNESFRYVDTICEISFVLMDLEHRGKKAEANYLLNCYLEICGDYDGVMLLNFYKVYLAIVRAKVSLFKLKNQSSDEERQKDWQIFSQYISLAASYTTAQKPYLAITYGVSGCGKSTVAAKVAGLSSAIRIRSDVERKRLFGLAAEEKSNSNNAQGIYTRKASLATFDRLYELANRIISAGHNCIVDATFITEKLRQRFARLANELEVNFFILDCRASDAEIRRRLIRRQQLGRDASEAGIEVMESQLKNRQYLSEEEMQNAVIFDTEKLNENVLLELVNQMLETKY